MFEQCLYFNSSALARAVTRLWTEAYREFDLSPPHAFLLRIVLSQPGLSPRRLAKELDLSRSTITRFLDSLEQRGFLQRKAGASDGRELQIYPTIKAKKLHQKLDATGARLSRLMADTFGEHALAKTVGNLRKMRDNLEQG